MIAKKDNQLDNMHKQMGDKDRLLDMRNEQLDVKDGHIVVLKQGLDSRDRNIAEWGAQITSLQDEAYDYRVRLANRDNELVASNQRADELGRAVVKRDGVIAECEEKIENLCKQRAEQARIITGLIADVSTHRQLRLQELNDNAVLRQKLEDLSPSRVENLLWMIDARDQVINAQNVWESSARTDRLEVLAEIEEANEEITRLEERVSDLRREARVKDDENEDLWQRITQLELEAEKQMKRIEVLKYYIDRIA